jgi:hypothetical protein
VSSLQWQPLQNVVEELRSPSYGIIRGAFLQISEDLLMGEDNRYSPLLAVFEEFPDSILGTRISLGES